MSNGNYAPPRPANFMIPAVLSTVCCCLPGGIIAIINAAKVDSLYMAGDYAGAERAAGSAKMWVMISVVTWVVLTGVVITLQLLFGVLSVLANQ